MGSAALNYRHHFHAGNFADMMKHALLLALIDAGAKDLRVVETHAGAGLYDLEGEMARKSAEAEAGIGRLWTEAEPPAPLARLKAAVQAVNPGALRLYPGSPLLALQALSPRGRYLGFELRSDDAEALSAVLQRHGAGRGEVRVGDGYAGASAVVRRGDLVLIDPPYEQGDDYDRAAAAAGVALGRGAAVALWAPIKDLETLDALVRRLEALSPPSLMVAEVRLRPLVNPMAMNGSAMMLMGAPDASDAARAVGDWVVAHCGGAGARSAVRIVNA